MSVADVLGVVAEDKVPVGLEGLVVVVAGEVLVGFEITDEGSAFVQDHGNAVRTVARCQDDLPFYTEGFEKGAAVLETEELCLGNIDRRNSLRQCFCKDRIGKMDMLDLRWKENELHALHHQFADETHVVGVIVGGEDVGNVGDVEVFSLEGAVECRQGSGEVGIDEDAAGGAADEVCVSVAVAEINQHGVLPITAY